MKRPVLAGGIILGLAGTTMGDVIQVPAEEPDIQAAIDAAQSGDEVLVAPGVYNEAIDFDGKAITLRSVAGAEATIIDASGLGTVSVVRCTSGEGPDTVLDGFTLTKGKGTQQGSRKKGGGMFNKFSSPTVKNCTFADNSISAWEFAISGSGAGMYNEMAHPTIENCSFIENELFGCSGWLNGGAGVYNEASSPILRGCVFRDNNGNNGGGMMNIAGSDPTLENCLFEGNHATYSGGGLNNTDASNATVINSVFRTNTAYHGAALYTHESDVQVVNATITGNIADQTGGGVYLMYGDDSSSIANSIIWGNTAWETPAGKEIDRYGGAILTVNNSNVAGGWVGAGWSNINENPMFMAAAGGDLHLAELSPCVDLGSNLSLPSGLDTDFDGNQRVVATSVDMGAFEVQDDETGCPADLATDGVVNVLDMLEIIGLWGECTGGCGCPGDLNGDCEVGILDLLSVMDAWGPCD